MANAASIRAGMLLSCGCSIRADMFVFSEQSYFPSYFIMVTMYSNWDIFSLCRTGKQFVLMSSMLSIKFSCLES